MPTELGPLEKWIEIDLARQTVALHPSGRILAVPPSRAGAPTPPGLYRVQIMQKGPTGNVPGVSVRDSSIFDSSAGMGPHSRPMAAAGNLLDPTLGEPATAGCVGVGDSAAAFEFARLDMRVWALERWKE